MFHSIEEQQAFEPASDAYDKFLEVREQCAIAYAGSESGGEEE